MRFHLIDRVTDYHAHQSIHGYKLCRRAEPYWRDQTMPSPLVIESFCQLAAWMAYLDSGRTKRAVLLSLDNVTSHLSVQLGQRLDHLVEIESYSSELMALRGTTTVSGETVLTVNRLLCSFMPAEQLEPTDATYVRERAIFGIV